MRTGRVSLFLLVLALCAPAARAQQIRLDVRSVPLEEALRLVSVQSGVDIVFAQRLIEDQTATCSYVGAQAAEALACVLRDSGIRAESVRRRQYVLVAAPQHARPQALTLAKPSLPRGSLSGFIADAETGEMLPAAQIYLPALRIGTLTNSAGYFALPDLPLGRYELRLSYMGYRDTLAVLSANDSARVFALRPELFQAQEVIVEGEREGNPALASLSGAAVLPGQIMGALPSFPGERDLFQTLQWVPGVRKPGELNGGHVVRGGETDQNLYLLDGVPVYHPWHAFSLISTFQTETFRDVRLYRGVFPAEYGGRLSSVLDTQLKDGSRTGVGAVAALSLVSGRLMVETPITGTSSLMVSARRSYLDQITGRKHPVEGPDGRRDTLRTGYHFYDLSAKLTMHSGLRHRLSLSYYEGRDRLDLRLPLDLSLDFSSWLRPADLFFEVEQDWGNRLVSARHQYLHSRRFFVTTTLYHSGYHADEGALVHPATTTTLASKYGVHLRDFGARVDVDWYLDLDHQVRAGVHAVRHGFHSELDALIRRSVTAVEEQSETSDRRAVEVSAYVQDVWQPSPRWQVMPGVRASVFEGGRYLRVDPALSVRYAVHPELLAVRAAAGTQVQYMHRLRDRFSYLYDTVSSRWIPAGGDVRPSSNLSIVAGAESRPAPWLTLSSDVYWRHARNILLPEDAYQTKDGLDGPGIDVGALLGQYEPAQARAYGVEFTAAVERGRWQGWLAYSGGRAFNRSEGVNGGAWYASRFDVPRSFQALGTYNVRRWQFMLALDARSGYPHTAPVARYIIGDPLDPEPEPYLYRPHYNNGRLPAYVRADASAAWRFQLVRAQWQLRLYVYNVLNHRSVVSRLYDPSEPVVEPQDRRGLPLLPLLELEVRI